MGILTARPARPFHSPRLRGIAAAAAIALAACGQDATAPYANLYSVRFSELWTRFQYNYPLFDVQGVKWNDQWSAYEGRSRQLRSQEEMVALLNEMLTPLHDSQIWLIRPDGRRIETFPNASRPANADSATLEEYGKRAVWGRVAPGWRWGRFGEVGYVALSSFERPGISASAVSAALDSLRNARAIIIDLRMNAGGDIAICDSLAGRFISVGRNYGYVRFREGGTPGALSTPRLWGVNPLPPAITRPILLLAGRRTTGAAEQLVLAMRGLSQVTVLGDTTGGSMGSSWVFDLGDGWGYSVSRFLWMTPEHAVIEGTGLPPGVYVRSTAADFERRVDPVLDAALARAP